MFLDLIPVSAQRENIRNVFPAWWPEIRQHAYHKTNYRCTYCGRQGLKHPVEAHEEWVFTGTRIVLVDVIPLCPSCHKVKHINFIFHSNRSDSVVQFHRSVRYYQQLCNLHLNPAHPITLEDAYRIVYEAIDMSARHDAVSYIIDKESIINYKRSIT